MKGERILVADDSSIAREGLQRIMESWGSDDDHQIIGSASSVEEVRNLLEGGLRPSVAIIDHKMPNVGDGERAAKIVRKLSPQTTIVSMSSDDGVTWGDYNLQKQYRAKEIVDFLTGLKH